MAIVRFFALLFVKAISMLLFRFRISWFGIQPSPPIWDDIRLIIFLNHTSLLEPVFVATLPISFLWRIANKGVLPAADVTMNRPIVGKIFRVLASNVYSISRKRDNTWTDFLKGCDKDSLIVFMPEGRRKRRNGLDKDGKPMTVRKGVADLMQQVRTGSMLVAVSGGLHRLYPLKKLHISYAKMDISTYLLPFMEQGIIKTEDLVKDLERIRDEHSHSPRS